MKLKIFITAFFIILLSALPVSAVFDPPHNDASGVNCGGCHGKSLIIDGGSPFWTDNSEDTAYNNLCCRCHVEPPNTGDSATGFCGVKAPLVQTHAPGDPAIPIRCTVCHHNHEQEQIYPGKYNQGEFFIATGTRDVGELLQVFDDPEGHKRTIIPYSAFSATDGSSKWADLEYLEKKTERPGGDARPGRGAMLVPDITATSSRWPVYMICGIDTSAKTITVKGELTEASNLGIFYGQQIRAMMFINSEIKYVEFYDINGNYSYTNNSATGICQVCHEDGVVNYWTNTGNDGMGHNPDENCVRCHPHTSGFLHGGGAGSTGCVECHGHDDGTCYGDMTLTSNNNEDCSTPLNTSMGAGTFQSHSTHTETDADDAKGPGIYCAICHDTDNMPRFKNLLGEGNKTLAETDICNNCHSTGGTYDGINDAVVGVKNNWSTGVYAATDDSTLQAGKEKWCATCHDESPSDSKFDDSGISAPNVIGDENASTPGYVYGDIALGWGYYKTGHGLETGSTYAASGGYTYGAGKNCDDCHDYSTAHLDGDSRTYSAGSDNYQAGYRLKSVNGLKPMTIPHPQNIEDHDPVHYGLCLSCHDANKYLIKNTDADPKLVTTSFRDDLDIGRDGGDAPINIHEYHLAFNSIDFDSDWNGSLDSEIACVNCHNVHGSTQLSMIRDGKLVGREPGLVMYYDFAMIAPDYTSSTPPNPANVDLKSSTGTVFHEETPQNICQECHGGEWVKYYRSAPSAPIAPTLDWTGEAEYTMDGVNPDSGRGGDFFTFRIEYTDANYQPPRVIQVWVDEDNDGYDSGDKHDMIEVDSKDIDVSDGKVYRTMFSIDFNGTETISYRFYASDGKFDATGAPISDNTITVSNNVPVLSWTGETEYITDGVIPDSAASGSSFVFRVEYTDLDNQCPVSGSSDTQVWIDEDDNGYDEDEKFNLGESGTDSNCADGKIYTLTKTLSTAGSHNYRFHASDGIANATGVPASNNIVSITSSNSSPVLSWTGESGYSVDGVDPDSAASSSSFIFSIKYTDVDNQCPASGSSDIQVWIDENDTEDGNYELGEKFNLTEADVDDTDCSNGKIFTLTRTLTFDGDGSLYYRFFASDGTLDAIADPGPLSNTNNEVTLANTINVDCTGESLQDAIDGASDGDIILVADGTCTETITVDNKDLTIKSVNGAALTIIDSSGAYPVVTLQNGADTVLDGLTITGGDRSGMGHGAGVYIANSSPTIANSIVTDNISQKSAGVYATGVGSVVTIDNTTISNNSSEFEYGGVSLTSGVSAVITDTAIKNNSATTGGGLAMITSDDASLTISGSTFSGNSVDNTGGAIQVGVSGGTVDIEISDSTLSDNDAQKGGALYLTGGAMTSLTITNNTINDNSSEFEGGGLYISGVDTMTMSGSTFYNNSGSVGGGLWLNGITTLNVSDSTIRDNSTTGATGGGMQLSGGTATFERCSFTGNSTVQRGGGAWIGGSATVDFKNCMVTGNKAADFYGGGFLFDGASISAEIINSTFSGNFAGTDGGSIGILNSASVTVKNSILYGNGTGEDNYEIYGTVTASYSDIRKFGGYQGTGNINIDPLFINPVVFTQAPTSDGDYHLLPGSPAIDQASADYAPADDFDGDSRPNSSGDDMGADEFISIGPDGTTVDTATAIAIDSSTINVSMPYLSDPNNNNTYTVKYKLSSLDDLPGNWTTLVDGAVHQASPYTDTISGLVQGETYDVRMTYNDSDGVNGPNPQTVSVTTLDPRTTIGIASATISSASEIDISMPYTHDSDGDNDYTVGYCSPSPCTNWTYWVNPALHAASPYATTITGLGPGTYDVQMAYNDSDGVIGDNPQTVTVILSVDATTAGEASATVASDTEITVTMPYTFDDNGGVGNNDYTVKYKLSSLPDLPGNWTTWVDGSNHLKPGPYVTTITDLIPGTEYDVEMTYNDANGVNGENPQYATVTMTGTYNTSVGVNCPVESYDEIFSLIQAAINDSGTVSGITTITVCDGIYSENIDYGNKNITIQSKNGSDVTSIEGNGTNVPVVTFNDSALDSSAVLDGFTIDNSASGTASRGIYISGASPTIKNSIIEGNTTFDITDGGGGVYINNGEPTFDTCIIRANTSSNRNGAGMYITGASGGATITNCTIGGNIPSNGSGGGIYFGGSTTGTLSISDSSIINNEGTYTGGGLLLNINTNPIILTNVNIQGNEAGQRGGGIYTTGSTVTITNSFVTGNAVVNSGFEEGGGIRNYGTLNIYSSTIAGNYAYNGGGIYSSGTAAVQNSIIYGNTVANINPQIHNTGIISVTYSDVEGGYTGDGNIDSDPLFVDFDPAGMASSGNPDPDGNFHVEPVSPCIDTGGGTAELDPDPPANDIDNDARPQPALGAYDMGADEYVFGDKTIAGAATAGAASETSIAFSMPYKGDINGDNTYTVKYKLSSEGSWTIWVDGSNHSVSPYETTITPLATGTYDVEMTYNDDTDGVDGTATQTVNNINLAAGVLDRYVCDDGAGPNYDTIQDGIDAALDGETVGVCAGTYSENITFTESKNIIVKALDTVTIQGTGGNSAPVVTFNHTDITSSTVLDGFTINNQASNSSTRGLFIYESAPTIKNCIIQDNRGDSNVDAQQVGGGGVFIKNSEPTFDNCTITANTSSYRHGHGMYITGATGGATITNCTIDGNHYTTGTNGDGGGIYFGGSTSGTLAISDSSIINNEGKYTGGGLWLNSNTGTSKIIITNVSVQGNETVNKGGGIYCVGSSVDIINSNITGNVATAAWQYGGGINSENCTTNIINSTVSCNQGGRGGGLYCTGTCTVRNSIFYGNDSMNTTYEDMQDGTINVYYSDVGSGDYDTFDNSITSDPLLVGLPASCTGAVPRIDGDYHLTDVSPCIDTGQDRSADGFTDDIEGDSRGTNGDGSSGTGDGSEWDIGADEYIPLP